MTSYNIFDLHESTIIQIFFAIGYTITNEIIRAFSLTTNASKILQTTNNLEESTNFSCLKGLKVISMLWVIFGHVYLVGMITGVSNMIDYFQVG